VVADTEDALGLTQAAESVGLSPGIFAWVVGGMAPAFAESVGDAAIGITGDLFWAPFFELPYNQEFLDGFMELFSDEYDDPSEMDYHSAGGFAGCMVMEQAVRNVGEIDQDAIAEELHSIEMEIPFANGQYAVNEQGSRPRRRRVWVSGRRAKTALLKKRSARGVRDRRADLPAPRLVTDQSTPTAAHTRYCNN